MNTKLISHIEERFKDVFKTKPILVFSPGRINLIGEHTDYNEGFVFPAAIDKGIVMAIQKSNSEFCSLYAVDKDEIHNLFLDKIQPIENGGWKNYVLGVIAEILKKNIELTPFDIAFGGNIPGGAGMSSSAALENSVVYGLNELFELGLTKEEMILISQKAEHNYVGVKCGIMDQYASMFGKENQLLLLDCREVKSTHFHIDLGAYELLLINTNIKHSLSDSAYNERRSVCEKTAKLLNISALRDAKKGDLEKIKDQISEEDYQKALYVIQEITRTQKTAKALVNNDVLKIGQLLYDSHKGLQYQYKVSCEELDFLVDKAKENKSIAGARMMGGGFGGCTINIIERKNTENFSAEVSKLYKEKFNKACSIYKVKLSNGTHLINKTEK